MTTAEQFRSAVAHPASREVSIAGVPWPAYKVLTLAIALVVLGVVAIVTTSAAASVLIASAVAAVAWVGFGIAQRTR